MKIVKYGAQTIVGGWIGAIVLAIILTAYHFVGGSYSYLLDGVVGNEITLAFTGFLILAASGSTMVTSPVFFLIFLPIYFFERKKTIINPHVLAVCSGVFCLLWGIYSDLPMPHSGLSRVAAFLMVFGLPVVLNLLVVRISRRGRFSTKSSIDSNVSSKTESTM